MHSMCMQIQSDSICSCAHVSGLGVWLIRTVLIAHLYGYSSIATVYLHLSSQLTLVWFVNQLSSSKAME
jgi:hypothetical protein